MNARSMSAAGAIIALLLAGSLAAPSSAPAAAAGATTSTEQREEARQRALEIRKLESELNVDAEHRRNLALRKLERELGTEGRVLAFAAPLSVILAIAAAFGGLLRYLHSERKERRLRIDALIAEDRDRLLAYTQLGAAANATAAATLARLGDLLAQARDPAEKKAGISEILADLTLETVDLDDSRQTRFDALCLRRWPDLKRHWRTHDADNQQLLTRYRAALAGLKGGRQRAFQELATSPAGQLVRHENLDEEHHGRLVLLLTSYREHARLLPTSELQAAVDDLGTALSNPTFATAWLS
jgi:hypothetical protein